MSIHDDEEASVVTVTKTVVVTHGEDTNEEDIITEGIHRLQTGRGQIDETDVTRKR